MDPLSHYLFLILRDVFSNMLDDAKVGVYFHPLCSKMQLIGQKFSYDLMIFFKRDKDSLQHMLFFSINFSVSVGDWDPFSLN